MNPPLIPAELDDGGTTAICLTSDAAEISPVLYVRSTVGLAEPTEQFAAYLRFNKNIRWLSPIFRPPYVFTLAPIDYTESFVERVVSCDTDFTAVLRALAAPAMTPEQVREHAVMQFHRPDVSSFSCQLCFQYRVDLTTFTVGVDHSGRPYRLPPGEKPHCQKPGAYCDKGDPETSLGVSNPQFQKLWHHYWTHRYRTHKLNNCPRYAVYRTVIDNVVTRGNNPGTDSLAGRGASRRAGSPKPNGAPPIVEVSPPDVPCLFCGSTACQSGQCRET